MSTHAAPPRGLLLGVLSLGISATSASAILIRWTSAPGLSTATGRMLWAVLLMGLIARWRLGPGWWRLRPREWALCGLAGVFLGLHLWSWITSLSYTSVASSVLFVTMNPLFVGLAAPLITKDKLSPRLWAGIALSMLGSAVVGFEDLRAGPEGSLLGNGLALLGSVCASGYFLMGRLARRTVPLESYATASIGAAALLLLPILLITGAPLASLPARTWGMFFLIAVIPQLIGHNSLVWSLRYLSAPMVALITLTEPVGAGLLAWIFLRETPTPTKLAGAALLLGGVFLATLRPRA